MSCELNQKIRAVFFLLLTCVLATPVAVATSDLEKLLLENAPQASEPEQASPDTPPPALSPEAIYGFPEHLFSAESVIYNSNRIEITGEWRQNHFFFSGQEPHAEIRLSGDSAEGAHDSFVEFNPLPRAVRRLVFYDVLPGGEMTFHYRLVQDKKTRDTNFLTLKIFAGQHQIMKMRFSPDDKRRWQKKVVSLKTASFLNRPIPVTFELSSDASGLLNFSFTAEVTR